MESGKDGELDEWEGAPSKLRLGGSFSGFDPNPKSRRSAARLKPGGWPIQARFWLVWGFINLPNPVIPTGAKQSERSGGTLCCDVESGAQIHNNQAPKIKTQPPAT